MKAFRIYITNLAGDQVMMNTVETVTEAESAVRKLVAKGYRSYFVEVNL